MSHKLFYVIAVVLFSAALVLLIAGQKGEDVITYCELGGFIAGFLGFVLSPSA